MADTATMKSPETGFVTSPKELKGMMEELEADGYVDEKFDAMLQSANGRDDLIKRFRAKNPELNGNAERAVEELGLFRQETMAKKEWNTWEYVKSIPGRVWDTMKAHPYISTAVILGVVGAAAYYSGVGPAAINYVRTWAAKQFGLNALGSASEAASGAVAKASEVGAAAKGAVGDAIGNLPNTVAPITPLPPIPTTVPSINDAINTLDALGKAG
ncbi:MAG: hypothetical protein JWM56_406 [Candidatus Peribacteria bacterium]|nr:hypothetical protein [Candidatus Peribacteria bacterium]